MTDAELSLERQALDLARLHGGSFMRPLADAWLCASKENAAVLRAMVLPSPNPDHILIARVIGQIAENFWPVLLAVALIVLIEVRKSRRERARADRRSVYGRRSL